MYSDRRVPFRDQDVKKIEQKNVLHSYLCEGFRGLPWISEVCCNKNETWVMLLSLCYQYSSENYHSDHVIPNKCMVAICVEIKALNHQGVVLIKREARDACKTLASEVF